MTIQAGLKDFWPRFLGKLWVVWAVRRWGANTPWGTGSVIPGAPAQSSPFAGRSWTMSNYIIGYIALKFAARFLQGNRGSAWAHNFFRGGFDALATKLVWTEAFARSPWLQQQFGQPPQGQVQQSPDGQTWMMQDGQLQALQGSMGQLQQASVYDGHGQIVDANALDGFGQIAVASPLDGMGDMMPSGTAQDEATRAAYAQSGSTDPYTADYLGHAHRDPYVSSYN